MTPVPEPEQNGESSGRAFDRLVRAAYVVVVVGTAYMWWEQSGLATHPRVMAARTWVRTHLLAPCEGCRRRRAAINRMLYEATEIVEEAADGR